MAGTTLAHGRPAFARARVVTKIQTSAAGGPACRVGLSSNPIRAIPYGHGLAGECRALQFSARRHALRRPRKPIGDEGGVALTTFAGGMAPHCWPYPGFLCASPASMFSVPSLGSLFPCALSPKVRATQARKEWTGVVRCSLRKRRGAAEGLIGYRQPHRRAFSRRVQGTPGLFQGPRDHRIASGPCYSISVVVLLPKCERRTSCAAHQSAGRRTGTWKPGATGSRLRRQLGSSP